MTDDNIGKIITGIVSLVTVYFAYMSSKSAKQAVAKVEEVKATVAEVKIIAGEAKEQVVIAHDLINGKSEALLLAVKEAATAKGEKAGIAIGVEQERIKKDAG